MVLPGDAWPTSKTGLRQCPARQNPQPGVTRDGKPYLHDGPLTGKGRTAWRKAWVAAGSPRLPDGAIALTVVADLPRPAAHFTAGGTLRASAPLLHTQRPDCSNVLKLAEDAMSGCLWHDDAGVVSVHASKRWVDKPRQARLTLIARVSVENSMVVL